MLFLAADGTPNPLGHVLDKALVKDGGPFGQPLLTMHMVTLVVVTALLIWVMKMAANSIATGAESEGHRRYVAKSRLGQFIEVIVLYMRDQTIEPILGREYTRKYLPLLMTIFFFILANNIFGLVPILDFNHMVGALWGDTHFAVIGGTATANISVTAALALVAFIFINLHGIRDLGIGGYLAHLTGGAPIFVAPLMIVVEAIGIFVKPVALAIRLFANMLAGHTLMATIAIFGLMAFNGGMNAIFAGGITLFSIIASVPIFFLEIFVAFLQAFIFMFLTVIFIGQLTHHHDHDDEHEHGTASAH